MFIQQTTDPFGTGRLPIGVMLNGRYMILRKIAQGGMGAVYEAKEVPTAPTSRRLAIKEMSFSMLNRIQEDMRKAVVESFHREYDLLSRLDHPNLVRAFHFFEENERQYFVMEYIEGKTLEHLLDNLPPSQYFPLDQVLAWARQLCNVLRYLHAQNPPIIYRDLKPSNIMEVSGSNLLKIFDFGIARFYKPGQQKDTVRFGTDGYLAPEIIAYQTQTSEQTDVYALGAVLHQVLTRYDPQIDPWRRPPIHQVNPDVPEPIRRSIERSLELNPDRRTPSADHFLKDLFGEHAEIESTNPSLPNLFAKSTAQINQQMIEDVEPVFSAAGSELGLPNVQQSNITKNLDLGCVIKGHTVTGQFQVAMQNSRPGQVSSSVPWLAADPIEFTSSNSRINVVANTSKLPLSRWNENSEPAWVRQIPGLVRRWLVFHLRFFVPCPIKHEGYLLVTYRDAPSTQVDVVIEVQPNNLVVLAGWLVAFTIMVLELILVFGVILSLFVFFSNFY